MSWLLAQEGRRRRRERQQRQRTQTTISRRDEVKASVDNILHRPELTTGLKYGALAVGVGVLVGAIWRISRKVPAPLAGLTFAAGALLGLSARDVLPREVVVALAVLAVAGVVGELARLPTLAMAVVTAPGAWMLANVAGMPVAGWVRATVTLTVALGGAMAGDFDRRWKRSGVGPAMAALTVAGAYATVPETKRVLVLVAAAVFVPLLGWPVPLMSLGRAGAHVVLGLSLWSAATDGITRPSAIVGATACIGLFAVEPLARAAARGRSPLDLLPASTPTWVWTPIVAGLHFGLVYVGSRVAGLRPTAREATSIAVAAGCVAVGMAFLAARLAPARAEG